MSKELKKKQKDIDEQFEKLLEQKQDLLGQARRVNEELLRLQGEYRLLENMIEEDEEKEKKKNGQ